jgi:hypothetical protein
VLAKVQPFAAYGQARSGDQIVLHAELRELREQGAVTHATGSIGSTLLAEATIYLGLVPLDGATGAARQGDTLRACMADTFPEWFGLPEVSQ